MLRNNKINKYIKNGLLALLIVNAFACWAESKNQATTSNYQITELKPVLLNVAQLGLTDCISTLALSSNRALAACRLKGADTEDDYGLRLFVVATDSTAPKILSKTRGLGDAYTVTLQLRTSENAFYKTLILADAAAEYAYGAAIYQLNGDNLKYLGEIGYVQMNEDKNPVSALNITTIEPVKDGFKISFSKEVYKMDKNGEYKRQAASKANMIYDGKKLR